MSQTESSSLPLNVLRALDIGKQSRAGALGLLIYERFIMIHTEYGVMWSRKRTWIHYLYIFNGWFALIWLTFDIIPLTPSGVVSSKICVIYLMFDDIVTLITTVTVQLILQARVWAIYERSSKMLVLLAVMSGVEVAIMATLVGITISRIEMLPVVSTATGCYYSGVLPLSALFWTPVLVVEPLLLGFVLFKAARTLYARGTIFTALARESLLYFLAIFAQLLIATIIWARFPTYLNVVMPWSAALPSLLGNRLLINMRQRFLSERSDTHTNDIELASIVFSRFPFLSSRAPGAHTAHTAHTAQPDAAAPDDPRRD